MCDRIKQGEPPAEAGELEGWLERTERALGVTREAGATLAGGRASGAGGYVLVQIRPLQMTEEGSKPELSAYGVKAWLLGTDRNKLLVGRGPDRGPAEVERKIRDVEVELPNLLSRWRDEVQDLGVPLDEIRFEFVVPRPLLGCKFDRLQVKRPLGGSVPLGAEHTVLVRPWERAEPAVQKQMLARYGPMFARERDLCTVIDSLAGPTNELIEAYLLKKGAAGGNRLYYSLRRRPAAVCACWRASRRSWLKTSRTTSSTLS